MIKDVSLTGIFVNDQEAALDFYTNKLGLEKVQDEPYGERALAGAVDVDAEASSDSAVGSIRRDEVVGSQHALRTGTPIPE